MISTKKLCKFSHRRSARIFLHFYQNDYVKNKHFLRITESYDTLTNMILAKLDCG